MTMLNEKALAAAKAKIVNPEWPNLEQFVSDYLASLPMPAPVAWRYRHSDYPGDINWALSAVEPSHYRDRVIEPLYPADAIAALQTRISEIETIEVVEAECREYGKHHVIDHDGFAGTVIGAYVTREGKRGVVLQQDGTRVVHVYGEKWLKESR